MCVHACTTVLYLGDILVCNSYEIEPVGTLNIRDSSCVPQSRLILSGLPMQIFSIELVDSISRDGLAMHIIVLLKNREEIFSCIKIFVGTTPYHGDMR